MEMEMEVATRHTCLKLHLPHHSVTIFVKGTWFHSHFDLAITDGLQAWLCNASEEDVRDRAAQWDQPVSEYLDFAERYLGFQQPGSVYSFVDAGDGCRRLSWTFEKEGTKLEWRWKCRPASDSKSITAGILDFLMDANIRLSDEVVKKNQSYERLQVEADKCLAQSERFTNEKAEFESAIFAKFVAVLNSKKAKLRELRDQISKPKTGGKLPQEEESTDQTQSFDSESDSGKSEEEAAQNVTSSSKDTGAARGCGGRRRTVRK